MVQCRRGKAQDASEVQVQVSVSTTWLPRRSSKTRQSTSVTLTGLMCYLFSWSAHRVYVLNVQLFSHYLVRFWGRIDKNHMASVDIEDTPPLIHNRGTGRRPTNTEARYFPVKWIAPKPLWNNDTCTTFWGQPTWNSKTWSAFAVWYRKKREQVFKTAASYSVPGCAKGSFFVSSIVVYTYWHTFHWRCISFRRF